MQVNKVEAVGIAISVGAMVLALFLLRVETSSQTFSGASNASEQPAAVVVAADGDQRQALREALTAGRDGSGDIDKLIIDDVIFGSGPEVKEGDTVTVHYIGSLQNGQQFDNTYLKETPFTFTIGAGKVIAGWERGVLGMQKGGQRVLVVPPEYAYGDAQVGPIPGGSTLVFVIELLSIN